MGGMATSDHPYKLIHADPRIVEDALRGFIAPDWADRLDFDTLAPLDKERIGPALGSRIGDKVWWVERKDGRPLVNGRRPYVNILLEFQSESDPNMAWRMHEYLYMLELNQREIGLFRREDRPPDFLAVVIHNGAKSWSAPVTRFGPLLGPPTPGGRALNRWRAYVVIDYPRIAGDHALMERLPADNRQAALIRLETAPLQQLPGLLLDALRRWDGPESAGLRRGFYARAQHVMGRHGLELPPLADYEMTLSAERQGGQEMTTLMEANVQRGIDEIRAQGMQRGIARGRVELLRHQAERRFGVETARRLSSLLDAADADQLIEVSDWIMECRTGSELLGRFQQAGI